MKAQEGDIERLVHQPFEVLFLGGIQQDAVKSRLFEGFERPFSRSEGNLPFSALSPCEHRHAVPPRIEVLNHGPFFRLSPDTDQSSISNHSSQKTTCRKDDLPHAAECFT